MKIKELIDQLERFDPELDIFVSDRPQQCLDGLPELRDVRQCRVLDKRDVFPEDFYRSCKIINAVVIELLYSGVNTSRLVSALEDNAER